MGILWRVFAPRGLKRARHALHPSWVIEDAIVRSLRGNPKGRGRARTTSRVQVASQAKAERIEPDPSRMTLDEIGRYCGEDARRAIQRIRDPYHAPEVVAAAEADLARLKRESGQ
jgi:hypothetical protein